MTQDSLLLIAGLVAWLAVAAFFWHISRDIASGRGLFRITVALLTIAVPLAILAPLLLTVQEKASVPQATVPQEPESTAPPPAAGEQPTGGRKHASKPRSITPAGYEAAERARLEAEKDRAAAEGQASSGSGGAKEAAESTPPAPPPPSAAAPQPVPPAMEEKSASAEPGAGGAPTPPAASEQYDSVPVFYGTDRDRVDAGKRIGYGTGRAKRLELGEAWVTVPKLHHAAGQIERPWEVKVWGYTVYAETEDPQKHFTVYSIEALDRAAFLAEVRKRLAKSQNFKDHALVFVHGYNTSFDAALYRSAQITYDLGFDGAPFMYSWPSQGELTQYAYDQNSSEQAQPYLKQFLDLVVQETGAKNLTIIAHSMGNLPLLRILNDMQIAAAASHSGVKINQIILAAPDVDRDVFQALTGGLSVLSDNVTLYASANDRAMQASRAFAGGVPRAGDVPETGPVVTRNVDTLDISNISTDILSLNHSAFAERSKLLEDIGKIVQLGLRPPPKREPGLIELQTGGGNYWKFPTGQ
jgi:esterase/lipase superfamily enzyme